jgi:hypothetical protein
MMCAEYCVWCALTCEQEGSLRTLGQVQKALGKSLPEMAALVCTVLHDAPYTKEEVATALGISEEGVRRILPTTTPTPILV